MGKHGGVLERQHVSIRAIALGVLLLAGIATISWWWSLRIQSDPIDQDPVAAQAFVVSSPSCATGGTGTVVDLLPDLGGQARAVINGCGYTDGQQLAVDYLAGDPSQARLAGTNASSGTDAVRQWWPIGLGVLVALATGLAVVLVVDGRPSRTAPGSPAGAKVPVVPTTADQIEQLTAMVSTTADRGPPSLTAVAGVAAHRGGRHALPEFDDEPDDDEPTGVDRVLSPGRDGWLLEPTRSWSGDMPLGGDEPQQPGDLESAPFRLDLVFPSTAELAASLQDELFTHRHAQVSG